MIGPLKRVVARVEEPLRIATLHDAELTVGESREEQAALNQFLSTLPANARFLRSVKTGKVVTAADLFRSVVDASPALFDGLEPNGGAKSVRVGVKYADDDDHFVVDTPAGPIRIWAIVFDCELAIRG